MFEVHFHTHKCSSLQCKKTIGMTPALHFSALFLKKKNKLLCVIYLM